MVPGSFVDTMREDGNTRSEGSLPFVRCSSLAWEVAAGNSKARLRSDNISGRRHRTKMFLVFPVMRLNIHSRVKDCRWLIPVLDVGRTKAHSGKVVLPEIVGFPAVSSLLNGRLETHEPLGWARKQ
jgi:hypothetical protein